MSAFRLVWAGVAVFLIAACGSPSTAQSPSSNPIPAASPASTSPSSKPAASPAPTPPSTTPGTKLGPAVIVGHSGTTVILMRPDGSVVTTLQGRGLVDEHAVGAYLVVASNFSTKAWTVNAAGVVKDVAPAAASILSPRFTASAPLIVDSTTAVTVRCTNQTCTADEVNLLTGAIRHLLTVPVLNAMIAGGPLTVLDVSADRQTVWLSKITSMSGSTGLGQMEIVGVDLRTGHVSSQGHANAFAGAEVAISRDGKMLAGQEESVTNSSGLATRHLHVLSLTTNVDSDVQGTAPYVGGQRTPSVLFAPGDASVAWWGGLDNGDRTFQVNVATLDGAGRTLYNPTQADFSFSLAGVFWVSPSTLVVQNNLDIYTINATTGAQKLIAQNLNYLDGVIN
jgi:hypothetical protein